MSTKISWQFLQSRKTWHVDLVNTYAFSHFVLSFKGYNLTRKHMKFFDSRQVKGNDVAVRFLQTSFKKYTVGSYFPIASDAPDVTSILLINVGESQQNSCMLVVRASLAYSWKILQGRPRTEVHRSGGIFPTLSRLKFFTNQRPHVLNNVVHRKRNLFCLLKHVLNELQVGSNCN